MLFDFVELISTMIDLPFDMRPYDTTMDIAINIPTESQELSYKNIRFSWFPRIMHFPLLYNTPMERIISVHLNNENARRFAHYVKEELEDLRRFDIMHPGGDKLFEFISDTVK